MVIDDYIRQGKLRSVERQVEFLLYGKNGTVICKHIVDFLITTPEGKKRVIEYKGKKINEKWPIKRKLFIDNYPDIPYETITPDNPYRP